MQNYLTTIKQTISNELLARRILALIVDQHGTLNHLSAIQIKLAALDCLPVIAAASADELKALDLICEYEGI